MPGRVMFARRGSPVPPMSRSASSSSAEDPVKRPSIGGIKEIANINKHKKKKQMDQKSLSNITLKVESPPLIFHGPRSSSTGARFTGIVELDINEPEIVINSWNASVSLEIKTSRPVHKDCSLCAKKTEVVRQWNLCAEPRTLKQGRHTHPINHIFSGDLPPTVHTQIGDMIWVFRSVAETGSGTSITFETPLEVSRALQPLPPEQPYRVVREFPGSPFLIELTNPRIIHSAGEIPIYLSVRNISFKRPSKMRSIWRVRKANWVLYEETKIVMSPCTRHKNQPGSGNRSILAEDYREVASAPITQQWKYDWSDNIHKANTEAGTGDLGGKGELEFAINLGQSLKLASDVDTPLGFVVNHVMVVDILMSEDAVSLEAGHETEDLRPTGQARCLRAKFNVIVTGRAGEGVSWDQETPPIYGDVPASPPGYVVGTEEESIIEDWTLAPPAQA